MLQVKENEARVVSKKKVLTIKDCWIDENNHIVDEGGLIGEQIKPEIPHGVEVFSFKITFDLPDDDVDIDAPDDGEFDNTETTDGYEGLTF